MTAYIIRRLLLVVPTLFGIMLINFAVVQIVPGGPVEQMIAQMTGTAVESTARFSGADNSENLINLAMDDQLKKTQFPFNLQKLPKGALWKFVLAYC